MTEMKNCSAIAGEFGQRDLAAARVESQHPFDFSDAAVPIPRDELLGQGGEARRH